MEAGANARVSRAHATAHMKKRAPHVGLLACTESQAQLSSCTLCPLRTLCPFFPLYTMSAGMCYTAPQITDEDKQWNGQAEEDTPPEDRRPLNPKLTQLYKALGSPIVSTWVWPVSSPSLLCLCLEAIGFGISGITITHLT